MNYEKITDTLIQKTMREFKMEEIYQEFLDSLIKFDDFKDITNKKFQEYLDSKEFQPSLEQRKNEYRDKSKSSNRN